MWDWLFSGLLPEVSEQWDYAMITLVVRFIGVFVVMAVMQVALQASARVVRALEKRQAKPAPAASVPAATAPVELTANTMEESALDDATVAVIGLALPLESRQPATTPSTGGLSTWVAATRMRQPPRSPGR
jgi:hypothetical protein